jgi:hypothetical protein
VHPEIQCPAITGCNNRITAVKSFIMHPGIQSAAISISNYILYRVLFYMPMNTELQLQKVLLYINTKYRISNCNCRITVIKSFMVHAQEYNVQQ